MAMLLMPGFMTDADLWQEVLPYWRDFPPPLHADPSQDGSIAGMAARALAAAPPDFIAVGFSMGGYVAREVARQAPGRVRALVLIATSARGDRPERAARKAQAAAQLGQGVRLGRAALARALHPDREGDTALIERLRAMGERLGPEAFHRQLLLDRPGDLGRLGEIGCPTLVVAGRQDRLRSLEEAAELRDGIPGASLQVVEQTGHMIPLEAPAALGPLVADWLNLVISRRMTR
ncbi:alpha/beta fold hydrolase [Roseomonas sp. 18066]|uniref:alpha/beta fold hydrolase n=1 Tax=Roseomonas sp. 18066 TaxID=2681412 RepID=UPI00135C8CA9|nr:alpha/beta fold hydrolase [Roseomonas sp. 18066]